MIFYVQKIQKTFGIITDFIAPIVKLQITLQYDLTLLIIGRRASGL